MHPMYSFICNKSNFYAIFFFNSLRFGYRQIIRRIIIQDDLDQVLSIQDRLVIQFKILQFVSLTIQTIKTTFCPSLTLTDANINKLNIRLLFAKI